MSTAGLLYPFSGTTYGLPTAPGAPAPPAAGAGQIFSWGGVTWGGPTAPSATPPPIRSGNRPSRNVLKNIVNFFALVVPNQDADGSQGPGYAAGLTNVRCSVQPREIIREEIQGSIRQWCPFDITFDFNPSLNIGDLVQWGDDLSVLHNIVITGCRNLAGRGGAFLAMGVEQI